MNNTKYRTLLRVLKIDSDFIWLIIPGWNSNVAIEFNISVFPSNLLEKFKEGYRFFGKCNIGNDNPREIEIEDFKYE